MAQEIYGLFDSATGDTRAYDADELARCFRAIAGTGVRGSDSELKVTADGVSMKTTIAPGLAMVQGYVYELQNDGGAAKQMTHSASGTAPRIDRVALRLNLTARTVTAVLLSGTAAANPTPPALTRNATTYEISLAQVRVEAGVTVLTQDNITDERWSETACGLLVCPGMFLSVLDGKYIVPMASASAAGKMSAAHYSGLAALMEAITPSQTAIDLGGKYIDNALFR